MRRGRILLFILACIAALAAICVCFPEDGLKLGKLEFRFPSLREIMVGDAAEEDEGPSPEELLAAQKKAATAAEKAGFEQPRRISVLCSSSTAADSLRPT